MTTSELSAISPPVLWGLNLVDYCEMFGLNASELFQRKIIECGSGPNAFHAELRAQGGNIFSSDPLFSQSPETLKKELRLKHEHHLHALKLQESCFLWEKNISLDELAQKRRMGLETFLKNYAEDPAHQFYFSMSFTKMDYPDFYFDLALSTYFLFGNRSEYPETNSLDYHVQTLAEWGRIAKEVRIFPVLDLQGNLSPLVGPVLLKLQELQFGIEIKEVPYHWQAPGSAMLRFWSLTCPVTQPILR